jgi:hypothetical protein
MPLRRPSFAGLAVLLSTLVFVACGSGVTSPSTTATGPAPTASIPALPSDDPPATVLPSDLLDAMRLREEFGLRADEAWVRAVAADPAAVLDYGVPMLPFERDLIDQRATGDDGVVSVVQAYLDDRPDVAGGLYIDQARGGIVTVLVTDDPGPHDAALRAQIGAAARIAVRQVRWTEAALTDLQERISSDQAFLASIPARMTVSSVDIIGNVVELSISSAAPDAVARIQTHVGAEPGQLRIASDGTGLLLQPAGRIVGHVIAPAGTDLEMLSPQYEADVDIGPRDAVGIAIADDGTFVIDRLPPTGYTVTILQLGGDAALEVGRARVTVPPGGAARVDIPVRLP